MTVPESHTKTEPGTVVLRIGGPTAEEGRVPLTLLADKLQAAQRLLFNIGSAILGGGRRGTWKAEVLEACNLVFVESRRGSLAIVAELPRPSPSLFPELTVGRDALDRMAVTLQALHDHDRPTIERLFPDYGQRTRVVKSALPLIPEEEAEYTLSVETFGGVVQLEPSMRPYLAALTREDIGVLPDEALVTLTGRLYLIEVETGQRHIGIITSNRRVSCYYSPEYEDVVREFVPGSLVEVEGRATLNATGEVQQIEEIIDARPVQQVPLHWTRVVYGNRLYRLRDQLSIRVDYHDGLWLHEYEPLGIIGYGETRRESLDAFRMEFASMWDYIALEDDASLTLDAQALKRKLTALVEAVEELS